MLASKQLNFVTLLFGTLLFLASSRNLQVSLPAGTPPGNYGQNEVTLSDAQAQEQINLLAELEAQDISGVKIMKVSDVPRAFVGGFTQFHYGPFSSEERNAAKQIKIILKDLSSAQLTQMCQRQVSGPQYCGVFNYGANQNDLVCIWDRFWNPKNQWQIVSRKSLPAPLAAVKK